MSKGRILIVEDEGIVAADLARKLEQLGYEVAGIAEYGEEAVALDARLRPDLVLVDIWLKGPMDGIQAAEAIRHQHDVPLVYLTAHSDPPTLARAKLTGPFGYILKPFDERDLATQIEMALFRHQADQQLRQQREWLRVTLASIGDAVIATNAEGRVAFLNPVAESLTGWKAEEASGQPIESVFRIVNEQTGRALEEPVARVLRERRAVELANHAALVTKDGRTVPIEDSAAPILDAVGEVIGAVLVFHDVTGKRRAEEALRRSAQEWERTFDSVPDLIAILDVQHRVVRANRAMAQRLGTTPEQCVGVPCFKVVHGTDAPPSFCPHARTLEDLKVHIEEVHVDRLGGDFLVTTTPLTDEQGQFLGAVHVARDITERKRAEEQIQKHAQELARANEELSRFNRAMVGRELRMIELKKEINSLCAVAGQPARYRIDADEEIPEVSHDGG